MQNKLGSERGARLLAVARERALLIAAEGPSFVYRVEHGLVSVEIRPESDRRRILDFLMAGDVLSTKTLPAGLEVRLRALQNVSLARQPHQAWVQDGDPATAILQLERAAMRTGLCGIIAGLSDIDARVASFLAAYAIRSGRAETAHAGTEIPLAREDVADHLLVNPDTLSRAYTRLRDLGVLGRSASSRPLILNWEGLLARTPIADLLVKTLRRPPW